MSPKCVFSLILVSLSRASLPAQTALSDKIEPVRTSVTVTGTRTATELDKSPVSTSLITREEIETRNLNQVDQALSLVEGVNAARAKGPSDSDFGVGLRGFAGTGGQYRTLVLLDGQPMNDSYIGNVNWALIPINELSRVEVARGPFSSLYGGNAMGGVINLITRPVEHRVIELFGQYGGQDTGNYTIHLADRFFQKLGLSFGYDRYQSDGYSNQPVLKTAITGTGAVPVTGITTWTTTGGGVNYQVGQRGPEWFNQKAFRGRAEYTFSPKTFASFQASHSNRGGGYDAYRSTAVTAQGQVVDTGLVSFADRSGVTRVVNLATSDYIGLPTGASVNTYQGQLLSEISAKWNIRVVGGINQTPTQWYVTPAAGSTLVSGAGTYTNQGSLAWYGNAQAGWNPNHRHQLIFGSETRHDDAHILADLVPSYASRANEGAVQTLANGTSFNQSEYVQDQIFITERLQLVAGGRYDYWHTDGGSTQRSATTGIITFPGRGATAVVGKLAAAYSLGNGLLLRASIGNAFRNPTTYELYRDLAFSSGSLSLANPNAKPERLISVDAGVKQFGRWANIDGSWYQNRTRDLIYSATDFVTDPTGRTTRRQNAGLARTRGIELAAMERPFSWLQLKQTYTFTDGIITENPLLPLTVGRNIPNVPRHMSSFILLLHRGRWTGSASGRYRGSVFSTDTNTDVVKGVPGSYSPSFTADITAGFRLTEKVTLTANAFNLLDRQYYQFYLSPPRQVFAGIRIRL
ncbi:MAG: TonB-dependent receptor [Bryobacterales bacterium]|nr:TonB-dependent receptor [Bryobacterales bacterium]